MRLMILGTGGMANAHAEAFQAIEGVDIVSCTDVDGAKASKFAKTHNIPECFDDLASAIADGGFEAVANVTPDAAHYETTMQLLAAGKHVFCEKPLATNYGHASEMADVARKAKIITGVNLTYRNVAALAGARAIVGRGEIGDVRHIEASYLQSWLTQPAWGDWQTEEQWLWRLSSQHGSKGVLGDVGIHILDFVAHGACADVASVNCRLKTYDKAPDGKIGEYTLDANDSFAITAEMDNGALAIIHASRFASGHLNDLSLKIFGTKGGVEVNNNGPQGQLRVCKGDDLPEAFWREVAPSPVPTTYERFAEAVKNARPMRPNFDTAAELQKLLDSAELAHDTNSRVSF